jgi:hypothetical protein
MGAVVIKIDKRNNQLMSRLAKELGGKVIVIDDEQYEDLALGKLMNDVKTGETVDYEIVMKKLRNEC